MSLEQNFAQKLTLEPEASSSSSTASDTKNSVLSKRGRSPIRAPSISDNSSENQIRNHHKVVVSSPPPGSPTGYRRGTTAAATGGLAAGGVDRSQSVRVTRKIFNNWRSACGKTKDRTKEFMRRWKTLPENHPDFEQLGGGSPVGNSTGGGSGSDHGTNAFVKVKKLNKKQSDAEINSDGQHHDDPGGGTGIGFSSGSCPKSSTGWSVHVWATWVQRGSCEEDAEGEEPPPGRDFLSDFQKVKLTHFFRHVLDMNHDDVISAADFVALNQIKKRFDVIVPPALNPRGIEMEEDKQGNYFIVVAKGANWRQYQYLHPEGIGELFTGAVPRFRRQIPSDLLPLVPYFLHGISGILENKKRIRHYIEWSSECIEFHILKEVHSGFLECFLNQPLDDCSHMYYCSTERETREHVNVEEWLDVWGTLLRSARSLEDLPLWLQYFPKILFQVINKSGSNTISREELRAFYSTFLGIDFRIVNETLDSIYNAMTDEGQCKITYGLFKLCFTNFLLAKYPHGPGQYLFGICSPQSLRCSFPIDYSALNTPPSDLEPYDPEKDKSQSNRRSVIV